MIVLEIGSSYQNCYNVLSNIQFGTKNIPTMRKANKQESIFSGFKRTGKRNCILESPNVL